jgi:hypothetical protein
MNERSLQRLKLDCLRQHSPRLYRQLRDSKEIEEYLRTKSKAAFQELAALKRSGYTEDEAWEVMRSEFLRPPDQ